jgi:hypothetical protein
MESKKLFLVNTMPIVILSEDYTLPAMITPMNFNNSKGVKIASPTYFRRRDFDYNYDYYLLKYTKNSLIKTEFGYID